MQQTYNSYSLIRSQQHFLNFLLYCDLLLSALKIAIGVCMTNNWQLNLAQGEWFEDNVAQPWLIENWTDWWITDCRLEKKSQMGGPKIRNKNKVLTLPDFRLDNAGTGETVWIDAKYKKRTFLLDKYPGEYFYTIDSRTYQDYINFMNTFSQASFYILIGARSTKGLYILDLRKKKPVWHEFHNKYVRNGRSWTPCFGEMSLEPVGTWDPTGMPI